MRIASKRLGKELADLRTNLPEGFTILSCDDLQTWLFSVEVLGDSCFKGERYALKFVFSANYPIEAPEVTFLAGENGWKAPEASHCYSNGHICLSILGDEWSPVLNTTSILLSIQSMLASCKKKERPPDNDRYVKNAPRSPKDTRFVYHDDTV